MVEEGLRRVLLLFGSVIFYVTVSVCFAFFWARRRRVLSAVGSSAFYKHCQVLINTVDGDGESVDAFVMQLSSYSSFNSTYDSSTSSASQLWLLGFGFWLLALGRMVEPVKKRHIF